MFRDGDVVTTARRTIDASGSEEALVECTRQGSGSAFVELALRHGDAVYAIVRNMSSSLRDARDAIQQTYGTLDSKDLKLSQTWEWEPKKDEISYDGRTRPASRPKQRTGARS